MTRALACALALLAACRMSLDDEQIQPFQDAAANDDAESVPLDANAACVLATTYSDLTTIRVEIFDRHCDGGSCHVKDSSDNDIELFLDEAPHAELVNVDSDLDPSRKLVVPGRPDQSWLLYMIEGIDPAAMVPSAPAMPPDRVGFMPEQFPLCVEKRDAIRRWIEAGALDN
jgi:hypothetical protein